MSGYDRRALTDEQRSLADDIASAMSASHDAECDVWEDSGDGCSCGLLIEVADGLAGARIVEVVQELGYDTTTHRGDRLERRAFNPHPLGAAPRAEGLPLTLLRALVEEVGAEPIRDNRARRMGAWIQARNYIESLSRPSDERVPESEEQ